MARALPDTVARFVERHELLAEGPRVVVGVSGGADSMVCLAVLHRLGYDVHALHVNYGLRPGADADEALVRDWCTVPSPPVPLTVVSCDPTTRAQQAGASLQAVAREQRYRALAEAAQRIEASAVAVGHHRDDQAETLLLNLLRGSGPEGLAGMPPARPLDDAPGVRLVRPLLDVARTDIEAYADRAGIPWREDPSNQDSTYDRAVLRTEVLPLLQKTFGNVSRTLSRAASLMREYVDHTLTPALEARRSAVYTSCEEGGRLSLAGLSAEPPVWRRRLILAALADALPDAPRTAAVADEIQGLLSSQVGRRVEVTGGAVWRERAALHFLPAAARPRPLWPPMPVPWGEDVPLDDHVLRIDPLDERPASLESGDRFVEYVDADRLEDPLSIGTWQDGDRLRPLGMEGTKLVSDLLTDAQVPPHRRAGVYVLYTGEQPAWVVGHRIDHRLRVRPSTRRVARLSWRPRETGRPREKTPDDCNSA
jgi:tRNA(Ile)-lysidine synthase